MMKYGLLFPGQGAQEVGMGRELYQSQPAAKWVFDYAGEFLGKDMAKLCFEGPQEELGTTANSQPAIFTASIATLNALIEKIKGEPVGQEGRRIFSPEDTATIGTLAMGLSLGEPIALVAAGALSFEDGLRFVEKRGQFMEEASREKDGKMASVMGLELDKVEKICVGVGCQIANLNSPGQVVISGEAQKIELASELAKKDGAKWVIPLKVSGAFHSRLMLGAKEKLKKFLDEIDVKKPAINFISNIDAEVITDGKVIKRNLADQLDNKTLWEKSVKKAVTLGITDYLEIGPGAVLKGLLKKIDSSLKVISIHTSEDFNFVKI